MPVVRRKESSDAARETVNNPDVTKLQVAPAESTPASGSAKYTLLYSTRATKLRAANLARTNDGREVEYTCMVEEAVYGRWQDNYKWDDAKVVGYMDSYNQITHISPPEEMWPANW